MFNALLTFLVVFALGMVCLVIDKFGGWTRIRAYETVRWIGRQMKYCDIGAPKLRTRTNLEWAFFLNFGCA
jgi:hypothetical protein